MAIGDATPRRTLYTIGHSNRSWEAFLALLQKHAIGVVADVRSRPRSRFPWFNGRPMAAALEATGIGYLWLGERLGGRPADPALSAPDGAPDYGRIAAQPSYREGIAELLALLEGGPRVAVLCSEGDPARCHREHLIAYTLRGMGVEVVHIPQDQGSGSST